MAPAGEVRNRSAGENKILKENGANGTLCVSRAGRPHSAVQCGRQTAPNKLHFLFLSSLSLNRNAFIISVHYFNTLFLTRLLYRP
jgi:hypothetical protein